MGASLLAVAISIYYHIHYVNEMLITLFGTATDSVIPKMIDISAILRPTASTTTNKRKNIHTTRLNT